MVTMVMYASNQTLHAWSNNGEKGKKESFLSWPFITLCPSDF